MADLFQRTPAGAVSPTRGALEYRYRSARNQLLWIVGFSALNLILLVGGTNTRFLFSAIIPLMLVDLGMYLCGMYPVEEYGAEYNELTFLDSGVFYAIVAVAFVIVGVYLLLWFLARKNKYVWLIVAAVLFALDSVMVLFSMLGSPGGALLDLLFHAWIMYSLISGIISAVKLGNLPPEETFYIDPNNPTQSTLDFTVEQ